ncbi:MAG: protein kinase [Phototrophicaceae bacterium]
MTNKIIGKRYALYEQLGAGGLGTVYRGIDTQTETDVAIKQLRPDMANEEQIARFKREGIALRDLNHPNIVKMWDAMEEDGNYYLILDYVVGGDLNQLLQTASLSPEKAVSMCIDVADALTRAHKLGIIHRDLKPANVLIAEDGTLRLTDFGIAHVINQDTVSDAESLVGTIDYMAPETLHGQEASTSMDIWAFGVMLFEMLAQKNPFKRKSVTDTLMAITQDSVPNLAELCDNLPIELEDLVYRMLERDPLMRISSVRHIGAILEDIQQGRIIQSHIISEPHFDRISESPILIKRDNLPEQVTEFIGREDEIQQIEGLLPTTRLITILAPGGMGKTRLSIEIARRNRAIYNDGIYLIELAELSDAKAIIPAIAAAVGCNLDNARGNDSQFLFDFLSNKSMLLVMDNYEHLLNGAGLVGQLLSNCASLTIIATSRQRLNQISETLFHLNGMDFPDWETPEDAADYAAVKLFVGSAKRAHPKFELTVDNLPFVARICRLVQGMPLGIVLSAAWLSLLEPEEIAEEIAQGIDFLEAEGGDLPERQRSIRAVFDYAWHMISEADRETVMALSIFQSGFTREAASVVANATIRQLMKLVNLSLLHRQVDTGRYHIHELLRHYLAEKLDHSGHQSVILAKHASYYGEKVSNLLTDLLNGQLYAINFSYVEFENLKAAMLWDIENGDGHVLNQIYDSISYWIRNTPRANEIQQLMIKAYQTFQTREINEAIWGKILAGYGIVIGYNNHDFELSNRTINEGLNLLERANEMLSFAIFKVSRIHIEFFKGDVDTAETYAQEAYTLCEERGYTSLLAQTVTSLGYISVTMRDNLEDGKHWYLKTLDLAQRVNNQPLIALAYFNLSNIYFNLNEFDKARDHIESAIALSQKINNIRLQIYAADILARLHFLNADIDLAENILIHACTLAQKSQLNDIIITAYTFLTIFYLSCGRYDDSLNTLTEWDDLAPFDKELLYQQTVTNVLKGLSLWGTGDRDSSITLIEYAAISLAYNSAASIYLLVLLGMMLIWTERQDYTRALEMLGLLRNTMHWNEIGDNHAFVKTLETKLKVQFSEDDYQHILQQGANRDYRETIKTLVNDLESNQ